MLAIGYVRFNKLTRDDVDTVVVIVEGSGAKNILLFSKIQFRQQRIRTALSSLNHDLVNCNRCRSTWRPRCFLKIKINLNKLMKRIANLKNLFQ